jgi:hypothetical protein
MKKIISFHGTPFGLDGVPVFSGLALNLQLFHHPLFKLVF